MPVSVIILTAWLASNLSNRISGLRLYETHLVPDIEVAGSARVMSVFNYKGW